MKRIINILALFIALISIFALMMSCEKNDPTYDNYTVSVIDGLGNPMPDVVVKITGPDGQTKIRATDSDGCVVLKNVLCTDYSVTLEKGFSNAVITQSDYALTKDVRTLTIMLRDGSKSADIYGAVEDGAYASNVTVGNYTIPCGADQTTYYVFYAQTAGIYKFSISSNDSDMILGYYGIPMFVQSTHVAEGEYDGKTFEIIIQDVLAPYVIGITATQNSDANLVIERIGDAPFDPEYAPWNSIEKNADIEKCVISEGTSLCYVDVTDPAFSVVERDGFYYTADGKPIYINLTHKTNAYLPGASLKYLAGFDDKNVGINIGGYIYDEDGNFVEKRSYNLMIEDYIEYCDSTYGVVPLTKELAECMQLHGTNAGWWNSSSGNYIFGNDNIVVENAWLFLCMIEG